MTEGADTPKLEQKLTRLNQLSRILKARSTMLSSLTKWEGEANRIFDKLKTVEDENKVDQVLELIFPVIKKIDELREGIQQADDLIAMQPIKNQAQNKGK